MKLIDLHCDTLWQLSDRNRGEDLYQNRCSVNIPAMQKAGTIAQFFACFIYVGMPGEAVKEERFEDGFLRAQEMIGLLEKQLDAFPDAIAPAHGYEDIRKNQTEGKISAVLTIEEGGILNGKAARVEEWYKKGVRLVTLMWNHENCLGYPNSKDPAVMARGLKLFGIEVVKYMGELGMIVDVSHASDGTFYDILRYAEGPVIASHSNCREICSHPRNLSDDMIRALAEKGGVAGLNFYGPFLGGTDESRLEDMTAHILHMIRTGGSEFPAIGTDLDGFDGMKYMDIPDVSGMEKLWDALHRQGVPESQLDKIWSQNALRVIREIS